MKFCLILLAALIIPLSLYAALPSAFEEDLSGNDLSELESMLSGNNSSPLNSPLQTGQYSLSLPSRTFPGPEYDPPFKSIFENDSFFGDFVRQLDGDTQPVDNQTWIEMLKNGTLYLNITGKGSQKTSGHFIKPILIEEPDF